ncbi:RDD family protein [Flammeovirga pacifica]|uniref:RDD domain-containing protein n=1 Tax=Flammeovirga pacifica TaxID=915059 RepID=A0A1S1YUK2_FLAPC|nr:RDD family protein [Flammeovirga pacifica]OHX64707.1 hypothetical protein NH26_24400 [Flammeovirga pacifica]
MSSISFQNSQNVNIQFQKANVITRIGAYLIDGLIIGAIGFIYSLLVIYGFDQIDVEIGNLTRNILLISGGLIILLFLLYDLLCEVFMEGQSLGKKAMNIRVASIDGSSVRFSQYLIRWVFRLLDITLVNGVVAIIAIIAGGKGQRVGDILAGTLVVTDSNKINVSDFNIPTFEEDYEPIFPQASSLNEKQLHVIKKALKLDFTQEHQAVILKLENKLKEQLNIETTMRHKKFLMQLMNDYYYYTIESTKASQSF